MSQLFAVLVCLSPLLIFAGGYYIGRYGSPVVIRRQRHRDRRAPAILDDHDDDQE